jgi:hypothetical protein
MDVSLRPVAAQDVPAIDRWAGGMADYLSRTRPYAAGADHHDPPSGLYWYVITEAGVDVGTVWIEVLPAGSEAVLGHAALPLVLRVRRSNARAIACYRHAGFAVTGSGSKSLPSGEVVPYYRMTCRP